MTTEKAKSTPTGPRRPKLTPGEKARANPRNLKFAIAAYCYHDCNNQDERNSHTTKLAIKECLNTECHLWRFRGFQDVSGGTVSKNRDDGRRESISRPL